MTCSKTRNQNIFQVTPCRSSATSAAATSARPASPSTSRSARRSGTWNSRSCPKSNAGRCPQSPSVSFAHLALQTTRFLSHSGLARTGFYRSGSVQTGLFLVWFAYKTGPVKLSQNQLVRFKDQTLKKQVRHKGQ